MDENLNVTMDKEVQGGTQEEVVESPSESYNDDNFFKVGDNHEGAVDPQETEESEESDAGEGGDDDSHNSDGADQGTQKQQTREENAAVRAARLRARREAEAELTAEADEGVRNSGVINPYTGKPFTNFKEFVEYGRQVKDASIAKKAKETGRSVEEIVEEEKIRDEINRRRAEEAEAEQRKAEARKVTEFIAADALEFVAKYPDVDVAGLENTAQFRKFCGSRFGHEPLAELYEAYTELVGNAGAAAVAKASSKKDRSTGGGNNGGAQLTVAQQKALAEWNEANPDLAMTPNEFLSRK